MKHSLHILLISTALLVTFIGISSFIVLHLEEIRGDNDSDPGGQPQESTLQPLSSTGDFLAFYTTLSTASPPIPLNIDVVSFPSMNGGPTTISAAWNSYNFTQANAFLPTNGTAYDPLLKEMICFISGELQYLQYKDNPMTTNMGSMTFPVSAPVFLNGSYYGILVEDGGFATPPMLEADFVEFDPSFGIFSSVLHFQTTTPNPFTYFNHESMSSATNRMDEIYFLSGTNLIVVTDFSIFTPHYCWIDLEPANSANNYHTFYGVEYKSPGVLLAIRETFINGIPQTDLVEIHFNSTTCTVNSIVGVYDLQSNIPGAPGGWIINSEYYSTAFDSCSTSYYISSLYDAVTSSRLIAIDIPNASYVEQILPQYLFGLEWKYNPCPCKASFTFELVDSCQTFQFINTTVGSNISFLWNFDDPQSGQNNTSSLAHPMHQFTSCGQYNVCMTASGPGCDTTICATISLMDIIPPVALCKSQLMIPLDVNCMASLTPQDLDLGSYDNCMLQSLSLSQSVFNTCGVYTVILTATDWCGNTATCNSQVSVIDPIPPSIVCPNDVYVLTNGPVCSMIINGIQWTALSDNCGNPSVAYTVSGVSTYSGNGDASGLLFNNGVSTVTYLATDDCGNTSTCSFTVTVDCICNCQSNMIQNSGFNQGSIMGNLIVGSPGFSQGPGHTDDWYRATETPWIDGTMGCCDPFAMYFWAYASGGESIYQKGLSFLAGHTYKISFCSKSNLLYGFQTTSSPVPGSYNPYNCSNCEQIGIHPQATAGVWNTYSMPLWTATQNADVLVIRGIGNGCCGYHNKGWIDNVCVQEVMYSCCSDLKAFEENASLLVNIRVDQGEEVVMLDIGPLLDCNRIAFVNWGDGSPPTMGPIEGNTSLSHVYPDTGLYEIQYMVQEYALGDTSQVCFEKLFSDEVTLVPDSCDCDAFSSLFVRSANGSVSLPLACGDDIVSLPCPEDGSGYSITGIFDCVGETCLDTSTIYWRMEGPQMNIVGEVGSNPYFSIDLLPTYFLQSGVYRLYLEGYCGNESCVCEIQFEVNCEELCSCTTEDLQAMETSVNKGFASAHRNSSCEVCFTPLAVSDCETVSWFLDDIDGLPLGTSTGNQSICYDFIDPGTYVVMMVVNRIKSDGSDCGTFFKSQSVPIYCQDFIPCNSSIIGNAGFNEGAVAGGLDSGGSSAGWSSVSGEPVVIEGAPGSIDGWTIQLTGNLDTADVLVMNEPVCFTKSTGELSIKNKVEHWGDPHENLNGKHVKDWGGKQRLYLGDNIDFTKCEAVNCYELGAIDFSIADTGWLEFRIPYDLGQWAAAADCLSGGTGGPGISAQLVLYATSPYGSNQGGIETRARMQLDQVCLTETAVSVLDVQDDLSVKIYPNPTRDKLIVELLDSGDQVWRCRVITLTGERVLDFDSGAISSKHELDLGHLPSGMYFVQIVTSKDKKVYTYKFVMD